ncbi:MAG: anthranilate synthase component I family protein [Candidatus Cohnella colombiensis]|uniref:Anthranilate synthase component I family protein n=1 Tax=Candidatus Cohnella colombiensis TaxID=3121368 RepID=A0AA95F3U3_9BACL|nr:MAG: anthranilate synthase component I family protein [Cohnella sp.]
MKLITFEQWKQWSGKYSLLPYITRLELGGGTVTPLFWDRCWLEASSYSCLLESGKDGRYSIVGIKPVSVIEGKGERAKVWEPECGVTEAQTERWLPVSEHSGAPLPLVRQWLQDWTSPSLKLGGLPDCIGGVLGLWSYDIVRSIERLPTSAKDDLDIPDYTFQRYEELWIADHQERCVYCTVHVPLQEPLTEQQLHQLYEEAGQRAERMEQQWRNWLAISEISATQKKHATMLAMMDKDDLQIDIESLPNLSTSMSKSEYERAVRRIQEYIGQGDIFQANLSLRQSRPIETSPEVLYEWLRLVNPSPYMGLLRTPSFALVSASPELLVKLDGNKLSTRPIAGTRRRGRSPEEDRKLEDELLTSEKERAEHVMLVDLERNDLGRVAKYGTVKVPELMTVERYSHVMHLVSQVEAELAPHKDTLDVLAAVFPGGTITGAPKVRTMEIIEELEPTRRGPYTGSFGWIDYNGNMEFNIIIRTIVLKDGVCHIQAGAGIVIDSVPEREFYESLNKAKALWKAVQYREKQGELL